MRTTFAPTIVSALAPALALVLASSAVAARPALADRGDRGDRADRADRGAWDRGEVALSPTDVTAQLRPYAASIERCYLDRTAEVAGAGKLSVELTVSRKGEVEAIAVKTPGLSTRLGVQIGDCIVHAVEGVAFPARRTHTTATVPFYFQRTTAPGAGPQLSCWDPAGCRSK